jgi:hypothetical protein
VLDVQEQFLCDLGLDGFCESFIFPQIQVSERPIDVKQTGQFTHPVVRDRVVSQVNRPDVDVVFQTEDQLLSQLFGEVVVADLDLLQRLLVLFIRREFISKGVTPNDLVLPFALCVDDLSDKIR